MAIEFKATADYNAVVTELDKVRRANEALIAKQGEMKKGANDNEKAQLGAMRELERFAVQTGRSVQTANERHQQQLEKLKAAFDANLLTAEQYGRAVQKANEDAANSYDVVAEKVERVDDKQVQATKSTEGLGAAVGKAVLGYLSFQAVLAKVGEALRWTREETEKAMGSFEGMADPRRRLAQVADPATPGRSLNELEARVDDLAQRYGRDRGEVANVMFSAISQGFEGAVEDVVKYHEVVTMDAAAKVAGQVPLLFQGSGLTPQQAVAATVVAAQRSPLSFEEIAQAMPTISEGASMTGATPAEAMGVLSVLSEHFTTGDQAATRFRGLATKMSISEDERLSGQGLLGGVEALQAMPEGERRDFLGEGMELNVAFQKLSERLPDVRQRIAEIEAEMQVVGEGGESGLERRRAEYFDAESQQGRDRIGLFRQQQTEVAREIANEKQLAKKGFETQAAIDQQLTKMKTAGDATVGQFAVEQLGHTAELGGTDGFWTKAALEYGGRMYGGTGSNIGLAARTVGDVRSSGFNIAQRIATGEDTPAAPWWQPTGGGLGFLAGLGRSAVQAGSGGGGADSASVEMLQEQRRQTEILERISQSGPRSGMSTLTQPQMSAQTIPR